MKLFVIVTLLVLYTLWRGWLRRKPVAREEYKEPPEFESIVIGGWTRPPFDQAAAREQRQFDSSGLDD